MKWVYENPTKSGKYVVETKTEMGGNTLKTYYNAETKKWHFNNQTFYRYLCE